uniref:Cholecystokinin n=1 Tax=Steinernema glaseri TaxID=37863 RepID=A0A1I8A0X1_9BILA
MGTNPTLVSTTFGVLGLRNTRPRLHGHAPKLRPLVSTMQSLLLWLASLFCIACLFVPATNAIPAHVMARRTPGEFDSLLSELKSKAMTGRMRFGKRSSHAVASGTDFNLDPDMYSPDRYMWLQ